MLIEVVHRTQFSYEREVVESTMEARLDPRDDLDQRRISFGLTLEPTSRPSTYIDGFGNMVHSFSVLPAHQTLTVTAQSRVETRNANPFAAPRRPPPPLDAVDRWPFLQFGGAVLDLPDVRRLAEVFRPADEEQQLDALQALMHHIYASFEYESDVTTVSSTVEDLLRLRKGVCQDFTHLMLAVCRAMEIPARYVSGYICGQGDRAARGDGASHAWCEAWVPHLGWRGFDPTNDLLAAAAHIKVGIGRDYHDVPPTRGVYRGTSGQAVSVSVTTTILDGDTASS